MSQKNHGKFLQDFQKGLRDVIKENPDLENKNHIKGLPRNLLDKILDHVPLSVFIPSKYGGRGEDPTERLSLLEAASYESIAVGLMLGINGSLFLEPVAKYGHEEAKKYVFDQFLNKKKLGGLMITEPKYGTEALSMQTAHSQTEGGYSLQGEKHWGGLTGLADFWLVTSRENKGGGKLARDINLFVCEKNSPEQKITVKEYYNKLGLFLIPYGLNDIDITVPHTSKLIPHSSGLKLMMDLLHRSRLRLSGIGIGFIRRLMDEALEHCRTRYVGGKSLLSYDQVQHRISQLQAWYTVNSAMCHYASVVSNVKNDLTSFGLQANAVKAVLTDMMQDSAQILLQLVGAKGYRRDHIAGRAVADSRPFQIFEGSNDVMYSQTGDAILKEIKKRKEFNFYKFLKQFPHTQKASEYFKDLLNFRLDGETDQRKRVTLGKITARLITLEFTLDMAAAGFRKEMIENTVLVLQQTIAELVSSFSTSHPIKVLEDYQDNGDWKLFSQV